MPESAKRISVVFFHTPSGAEPVREWLWSLSAEDRRTVGRDIRKVEWGWPIGMPTCRPLGSGLWEVRSSLSDGRIARVIFCIENGEMYLLNGFIKKSQNTPRKELNVALLRQREVGT